MSLSTCEKCGGFIPLGPKASNRCEKCGSGVFENQPSTRIVKAIQNVMAAAEEAAIPMPNHSTISMSREDFEKIVKTLKDAVNDAMSYGESEADEGYEAVVALAEGMLK